MVCLTTNGIIRWKLPLTSVPDMEMSGVSNIVSDRQGYLFYMMSWVGDGFITAKRTGAYKNINWPIFGFSKATYQSTQNLTANRFVLNSTSFGSH